MYQPRNAKFLFAIVAMCTGVVAGAQPASTGSVQAYPVKPIRVVIGGSPGSNADIFFRIVATRMGAVLGQQLVADYRPGAGGASVVARE
jgi:tripartite-type tricarboxylate transporter receptor subunit TctC